MPSFEKMKFTASGLVLQGKAQAGNTLKFSKIKLGKGKLSGNLSDLRDLMIPMVTANIIEGHLQNTMYTVKANATNDGITEGFYWTEIGLFAVDENGNDVLYAYASTDEETDYIPARSESSYMKRVKIAVVVGDASDVQIVTTDDTYIDAITFNEHITRINGKLSEINTQLQDTILREEFGSVVDDVTSNIMELGIEVDNLSQLLEERINSINNTIGTTSIAGIGNGSIKGAIAELYRMISEIPAITSGTAEPSGGEDGDVYVMYEE